MTRVAAIAPVTARVYAKEELPRDVPVGDPPGAAEQGCAAQIRRIQECVTDAQVFGRPFVSIMMGCGDRVP
jgi:hypothetical protein